MMSVSEYASDVGLSVKEILNLCQKLNISVTTEKDELSEEDIILLDNELANEEAKEELPEDFEDSYEEELEMLEGKEHNKKKKQPKQ